MTPLAALSPSSDFVTACYIVAFSLFIFGDPAGARTRRTAKRGNLIAAVGMAIAVVDHAAARRDRQLGPDRRSGSLIGTAVGVVASLRVQMTEMPQMVALYNGVGGGAVALIAWSEFRHGSRRRLEHPARRSSIPILFSAVIGSVSFWGSNIAFGKLQDLIPSRPIAVPGPAGHQRAAAGRRSSPPASSSASTTTTPSQGLFIGVLIAAARARQPRRAADRRRRHAGRDLAAQRVHRPLGRRGRLRARQRRPDRRRHARRLLGNDPHPRDGDGDEPLDRQHPLRRLRRRAERRRRRAREERPSHSIGAQDAAIKLAYADSVVIVPGYGMAVAQAQHAVKELANELEKRGVEVNYAIHPVAGRMPGHMNVLLAEADVPYEKLKEMDEINPEMPRTDVAVVIGANDVTNPAAKNDPDSPIAGMPIIEVDEAQQVIVIKRSLSPGFAGIDNDLFYEDKTSMLFGDAKGAASDIAAQVEEL